MTTEDPKEVAAVTVVSSGIRQALENDLGPGNVMNPGGNPGQVHLHGFYDLSKIARAAIASHKQHIEHVARTEAAEAKRITDEAAAKLKMAVAEAKLETAEVQLKLV